MFSEFPWKKNFAPENGGRADTPPLIIRNFQRIIYIWTQTYGEIFKFALVYL